MDIDLYIDIPEGLQHFEDVNTAEDFLNLKRTIYCTVQAAKQWWKYFIQELKDKLDFKQSRADPCLLVKLTEEGIIVLCIYIDNACFLVPRRASYRQRKKSADFSKERTLGPCKNMLALLLNTQTKTNYYSVNQTSLQDSKDTLEKKLQTSKIIVLYYLKTSTLYNLRKVAARYQRKTCSNFDLEVVHCCIL